ncbi:MAG: DUF6428 family protein [Flavobacteriaceae bacterium]
MKTQEFLELLKEHPNKSLLFDYKDGNLVGANYHITEIKNTIIDAVDCGSRADFWRETVIQLWESPKEKDKTDFMGTYKALGILNKVNKIKPMAPDAELKFEYSNAEFHTAQLFVNGFTSQEDQLLIRLAVEKTDCKAKDECGVSATNKETASAPSEACCSTEAACC